MVFLLSLELEMAAYRQEMASSIPMDHKIKHKERGSLSVKASLRIQMLCDFKLPGPPGGRAADFCCNKSHLGAVYLVRFYGVRSTTCSVKFYRNEPVRNKLTVRDLWGEISILYAFASDR